MRHQKRINHLGRTSTHRRAMLANMACSLIKHKRINTTVVKAKALRMYLEPLLTKAKEDSTHSRRVVFSYLQDKEAVTVLFREVSVKIASRPGGYTRILKTGSRIGDNADMCLMELVDFNENLLAAKEAATKKTTRRRRGSGKTAEAKAETVAEPKAKKPIVAEAAKTEEPAVTEEKEATSETTETPETTEEK
jgi:large subunit ribosomal protein L17